MSIPTEILVIPGVGSSGLFLEIKENGNFHLIIPKITYFSIIRVSLV